MVITKEDAMGNDKREWIENLDDSEIYFIKRFILESGSLKEMAAIYGVSYPTVRLRLDRLIEKIKLSDKEDKSYVSLIKSMAIDGKITLDAAKILIEEYKKEGEEK